MLHSFLVSTTDPWPRHPLCMEVGLGMCALMAGSVSGTTFCQQGTSELRPAWSLLLECLHRRLWLHFFWALSLMTPYKKRLRRAHPTGYLLQVRVGISARGAVLLRSRNFHLVWLNLFAPSVSVKLQATLAAKVPSTVHVGYLHAAGDGSYSQS